MERRSGRAQLALRWILSAALTYAVLYGISWGEVWRFLRACHPAPLLVACCLLLLSNLISSAKVCILLSAQGFRLPLGRSFGIYMMGFFLNHFLPMGAGDIQRFALLSQWTRRGAPVLAVLFWERWSGLLALLLVGACFFSVPGHRLYHPVAVNLVLLTAGGVSLLSLLMIVRGGWTARLLSGLPLVGRPVASLVEPLEQLQAHPARLAAVLAISLVQPFLVAGFYGGLFAAMGHALPSGDLFVFAPYITLLIQVPLFVNGLGIQEAGFFHYLGSAEAERILAVSLAAHLGRSLVGLVGGVFLALEVWRQGEEAALATPPFPVET